VLRLFYEFRVGKAEKGTGAGPPFST
jgi:hypothetical protein